MKHPAIALGLAVACSCRAVDIMPPPDTNSPPVPYTNVVYSWPTNGVDSYDWLYPVYFSYTTNPAPDVIPIPPPFTNVIISFYTYRCCSPDLIHWHSNLVDTVTVTNPPGTMFYRPAMGWSRVFQ